MSATCPSCSWSSPMHVSSHRSVRYLRCVCGMWLVAHRGGVHLVAGTGKKSVASEHFELIPLPEA